MKQQWFPIHDNELGTCTIIAPRTGHMVVSKTDYRRNPMPIVLRIILGTYLSTRNNGKLQRKNILDFPVNMTELECAEQEYLLIKQYATFCLRLFPLATAIALMQLLFPMKRSAKVQVNEAIRQTAVAFGRRSNQDCLVVSLCRHVYLRRLGIPSKILLGAHVPTEKMHAWVQIADQPILECPDVLVHYQSCVAYW